MKLAVACDHAGFDLKEGIKTFLESEGHTVEDFGCYDKESCDYPDYARKLCNALTDNICERGVLVCGSGLGMSYAANRHKGIRAALCVSTEMAELSRSHNDANVLVLGARIINPSAARDILRVWMETPFDGGRHLRRIRKIDGEAYDE
jgi:ribose 5-phosphate isomerase B